MRRLVGIALVCGMGACSSSLPDEETLQADRTRGADRGESLAADDDCRDPLDCAQEAERYERGDGVERDMDRALVLYERACRRELWKACTILGYLLEGGHGAPRNARRATALYELACAGGERVACSNLGLFYLDGHGVQRSPRRAASLFSKSCELGHGTGCVHLARVLETGVGDRTSALYFRLKGCLAGQDDACAQLRRAPRAERTGVAAREKRAEAACTRGDGKACVVLGHLILEHQRGRRAEKRAFALYRKACDMSQAFGCLALARMFRDGRGVSVDRRRADSLGGRACAMDPLTCPPRRER